MVNNAKIEKKLPGLLVLGSVQSTDSDYQMKRYKLNKLKQKSPNRFNCLMINLTAALDELDHEAEKAGFCHIDIDAKGNFVRREKKY